MKRIAFVDLDIDNFHANVFSSLLKENETGFVLSAVWAKRQDNLAAWAEERGVTAVEKVADLADLADYIMVLAPSNPEAHLELCREAFALKKTTYVDKTFAPDAKTAEAIFALADEHGIAIQSTSVLRYTELQDHCAQGPERAPKSIDSWAAGGNYAEYLVHPLEAVFSVMGSEVEETSLENVGGFLRITLRFSGNRIATVHMYENHGTPFFSVVSDATSTTPITIDSSKIFRNGLLATLEFFKAGTAQIPREETLAIMRTLDTLRPQLP